MASRAPKVCCDCTALVYDGSSRCAEHRKRWSDWPRSESSWVTGTREFTKLRRQVMVRDGGMCRIMGPTCTRIATEVGHIVEVSAAGAPYDPDDCRSVYGPCHAARSAASRAAPPPGAPPAARPVRKRRRARAADTFAAARVIMARSWGDNT